MYQTSDNSQLLRRVLWINAQLTIVWSLKHHSTQPILIFNRENPQNSESPNGPKRGLDFIALGCSYELNEINIILILYTQNSYSTTEVMIILTWLLVQVGGHLGTPMPHLKFCWSDLETDCWHRHLLRLNWGQTRDHWDLWCCYLIKFHIESIHT